MALFSDAAADTEPLAHLISTIVDAKLVAAIAREYAKGRRLFIGTTNLDAQRPVVWDMGAIASSGQAGAIELFRKIMLASASIPAAFPPVYFDVEADGKKYQEMHVDGGTMAQMFHIGAMLDYEKVRAEMKSLPPDLPRRSYVIRNGAVRPEWASVTPRFIPIAGRAVSTLLKANAASDLYRIYAMCRIEGIDFNLAYIPDDYRGAGTESFDKKEMQRLFDVGFTAAKTRTAWKKAPPGAVASAPSSTTMPDAPSVRKGEP